MSIADRPETTNLEPALQSLLARLRRRIRTYVWADCLALAALVLGAAFWISLALDWSFEPPRALRIVMLACVAIGLGYIVVHLLLGRLSVRLADRNMAVLLERRFGDFRDALLTSVELADEPSHAVGFNREMLAQTHRAAIERANKIDISKVFNTGPLMQRTGMAMIIAATLGLFAMAAPNALGVWARRNLLLSDELWPRRTHLLVEGFDDSGHIKVAKGSDWDLLVKADAATGAVVPERVQVRYSTQDGARGRENMSREGVVTPGEAQYQNYTHTFKGVLSPLEFHVLGGDDRRGPYHLDVVDSPTISRLTLHCEYPEYMHRSPRDIPASGVMELARGTQITIRAETNKPLVSVRIDAAISKGDSMARSGETEAGGAITSTELKLNENGGSPRTFEHKLARLDTDQTLLFTLFDTDNIKSRRAEGLTLHAVADEPPTVNVHLKGIGTAMTPQAQLPALGEVADDYGVHKLWFDFHADDDPAQQRPLVATPGGEEKISVSEAMEVRDLGLAPKQKFHWTVQAADGFALDSPPNVGSAQKYVLDVVTPEQLRSMLEARELMLRRRFEVIIEELTDTRNLLAGIELGAAGKAPLVSKPAEAGTAPAVPPPDPLDDEAPRARPLSVQVERVLQNSQRASHETLQVAIAFDDIRAEMVNNRIDTEELKTRLKDGVADPLRRIVEQNFPQFDEALKRLTAQLADPATAAPIRAEALAEADRILNEMRQILSKMLELETFNEVLDLLREIIDNQERINIDTKARQRQRLQDLTD